MCSCGARLPAQLGGEEALQRLLRVSPPCDDDSSSVETLEVNSACFFQPCGLAADVQPA
jgi:hypothetical protein